MLEPFWTDGGCCLVVWDIMRCRRRAFRDCTGITMEGLVEELKDGKGRNLGDLGEQVSEKIEK